MKKNKLHIHMGFDKTGSTSIQISCTEKQNLLKRHGLIYPQMFCLEKKDIAHQNCLLTLFRKDRLKHIWVSQNLDNKISEIKDSYETQLLDMERERDILLSGEAIGNLSNDEFSKLINFFADILPNHEIKPFAYIRSPYSRHCSHGQQRIKMGQYVDIRKHCSEICKIKKLNNIFNDFTFYPYSDISRNNGDVTQHFFNIFGVNIPKTERRNVGRGNKSIREQNQKNKINPKIVDGKLNPNYDSKINVYEDDTKFYLTKSELASIKNELDAENDFFRKELGQEFCDDSFPTCD